MSSESQRQPSTSSAAKRRAGEQSDHGWWPYLAPYLGFLVVVQFSGRMPEAAAGWMIFIKPAVPAALILYFFRRGAYPELRGFRWRPGPVAADIAVGLGLTVVWVVPFLFFSALRPEDSAGFDPAVFGAGSEVWGLAARMLGFALVTPVFEELFIRSFVMRVAEVFHPLDRSRDPYSGDFRDVPIAQFTWRSFLVTTVIFTIGHVPWEWWVAIPWIVLSNLWFYRRKHIMAVIIVHATTNAALLLFVATASGRFPGPSGQPLSLWFFI